ncbi:ABC transporter [Pseudomonas daroniae]|uniref:ABC transporter n=1 Tax=Phytopseudomonas daroniae TaxID=2487519 RepID=A0A4Q9QLN6_9GAMM|nr:MULTISPECIES: ABC transporter ATP-binding protein [Pseudomonas]TBU78009.1 ABC transporter [Pseudomonas daroniae]TBU82357.1 ABC transporter [Pseudomonas sp. FRB 228]TBU91016.1 ABC transporter [Pseudomonas daroniae]
MSMALTLQGVGLTYQTRRGEIQALDDVDMSIGDGEFVAVLGPSGCGKSTILKLAAGLLDASSGRVAVAGRMIDGPGRHTGVVFQKPNLLPWKTVLNNVLLPARTLGLPIDEARRRAMALLELVGLGPFANDYPFELSGGMQQRVGIARMLLHDPQLLLMDEPFAALDALSREALTLELQHIWSQQRKSVLFITHSIQEAVFLADRVLVMSPRPGRIIDEVAVTLPRPRTLETLVDPAFTALCQHLRRHFTHA